MTLVSLSGWGNTAPIESKIVDAEPGALDSLLVQETRVIARGLGRAYGDCAYLSGGVAVRVKSGTEQMAFDAHAVEVSAGVSLDDLMRACIPRGLFVSVTPGTRFVTIGGAIAADIHGKNHHRDGSFGNHCEWIDIVVGSGETIRVSPQKDYELFWATVGGMGLTGIIVRARVSLLPITTAAMSVRTSRHGTLAEVMSEISRLDSDYRYTVAWVDTMAIGSGFGRSVLWAGNHAVPEQLSLRRGHSPLDFGPRQRMTMPNVRTRHLISPTSVRAFNRAWFMKAPKNPSLSVQSIPAFFHPLDGVGHWNRIYGRPGFVQYQFVVPNESADVVEQVLRRMAARRIPAFLSVLKKFGPGNSGFLSFPRSGWTLAVDVPAAVDGLASFLDEIDDVVAAKGGRIYLAKDSRMRSHHITTMYPDLERFRDVRSRVDPSRKFASNMSRRLGL